MAIDIVDLPSCKMVIFHSYVSLPEGMCFFLCKHVGNECQLLGVTEKGTLPKGSGNIVDLRNTRLEQHQLGQDLCQQPTMW